MLQEYEQLHVNSNKCICESLSVVIHMYLGKLEILLPSYVVLDHWTRLPNTEIAPFPSISKESMMSTINFIKHFEIREKSKCILEVLLI